MKILLVNRISDIRKNIEEWKSANKTIGLVPTMGALHDGHISLIKKAKETCDKVIVSIFVNPIQFGQNEDFDKYPRTLDKDASICEEIGADIVFAPTAEEMYGNNKRLSNTELTFVCPAYNVTDCMCGKTRIGHFDGVATVVLKLFNITQPDFAFFGQKDAQQLFILKKMVRDFNLNLKIISCPIVREKDGLAMSSRNIYLSNEERKMALSISQSLKQIKMLYNQGIRDAKKLFDVGIEILDKKVELEYLDFRNFDTLEEVKEVQKGTLVAIAAKCGNTRLIDNEII